MDEINTGTHRLVVGDESLRRVPRSTLAEYERSVVAKIMGDSTVPFVTTGGMRQAIIFADRLIAAYREQMAAEYDRDYAVVMLRHTEAMDVRVRSACDAVRALEREMEEAVAP